MPSWTASSWPVTVTVWSTFQVPELPAVKVSVVEDAGAPPPADTSPSPGSRLSTVTVTAADGWVSSATVKVAVPPASVAWPVTAPTSRPKSSSRLAAYTVTAESAS